MRLAAFSAVHGLMEVHGDLTSQHLRAGFVYGSERIPLINRYRGIFKPRRMQFLLSICTVFPKKGAKVWYDDQREVHRQIYQGDESIDYAFMGTDADAADNRWLREAMENRVPIIYFLGVAPGVYQPIIPTYVVGWDAKRLKASIAFGAVETGTVEYPGTTPERRYALREVKQRLHQASFREAVIAAYGGRCAVSGLPEVRLLDAAHIVSDGHHCSVNQWSPTDFLFRRSTTPRSMPICSESIQTSVSISHVDC
jgi:putative restriction endonuclease